MDRSTIHYLKQKGWTNTQIAQLTGHHRDTVAQVLREPLDKAPAPRDRSSSVSVYDDHIRVWVEEDVPVSRMLELARADTNHPYKGGPTAFFDYVRKFRRNRGHVAQGMAELWITLLHGVVIHCCVYKMRQAALPGGLLAVSHLIGRQPQCPLYILRGPFTDTKYLCSFA